MDELRGPTVQIVLHVKEGIGFGFLKSPFIVTGSLNGYKLETDPVVPGHAPFFDAELVWEADKRRFRNLRIQNVPIKVEVHTLGTQGRKDKVGYLLLSLLGATPCPNTKFVDIKYTWHKLLGVRSGGKCCQPQLMLSLSLEDRNTTITPRNELRLFHSNEVAYPPPAAAGAVPARTLGMTVNDYIAESKKTVTVPELEPKLICEEGLIQIGDGNDLFVLSFVIGATENIDALLPDQEQWTKEPFECHLSYTVFTHEIMTDRVPYAAAGGGGGLSRVQFNQRSCLRVRGRLVSLARYLALCPHVVVRLVAHDADLGICSIDLRKIVPTDDLNHFLNNFCNTDSALTIQERCYLLPFVPRDQIKAYVDVEISLKYIAEKVETVRPSMLTSRSVTRLETPKTCDEDQIVLDCRSGSCTNMGDEIGLAYTNISARNTNRYRNAQGEAPIQHLQTNEIADIIQKMCESFTQSQERLINMQVKPTTSDMQVQCEPELKPEVTADDNNNDNNEENRGSGDTRDKPESDADKPSIKSDSCIIGSGDRKYNEKDMIKHILPLEERDSIMKGFVEELEDWKEKQQELYKCQLMRKEEYHLELLAKEWAKKQLELECKLSKGIEQCRTLAMDLSRATEDFRLRGYRNTERERKLLDAKKALEQHYTAKFQELREASQKMEDDMNHQLKVKDMRIDELELKIMSLEKQVDGLKKTIQTMEKESENKYTGLTKEQTASLIQELRCLEEKLDSAVQSKGFFKEQWGRAVRELHFIKLTNRKQMLSQLKQDRRELGEMSLDTIDDQEEETAEVEEGGGGGGGVVTVDMERLKDDYYVDILANTPLHAHSYISTMSGPEGMEMYDNIKDTSKNSTASKLNDLTAQRDKLIKEDNPDENKLKQLNHEIRNILINNVVN